MKNGILYGVGVGPGEPELLTMKAARLIRESEVVALPGKVPEESLAYQTAVEAVPELAGKTLLLLKRLIAEGGYEGYAVMRCGMEGEQVFYDLEDLPDDAGYMTLMIAKKR